MELGSRRVQPAIYPVLMVFLGYGLFAQNTIHVPADQPTIQGAINAANNGDTVLVAPGTYHENINFNGKAITVTSSAGSAQTIIDGGGTNSVVIFSSAEGLGSVLNGFTIQNGSASFEGGGIDVVGTSPTITNNVIQSNNACVDGGGIAASFASPLIQGNTIRNNTQSSSCIGNGGGGIALRGAGQAQIIGNLITNNSQPTGNGGGIYLNAAGTPTIRNNIIAGNTTAGVIPGTQGGGIYMINSSNPLIVQNLLYNNSAGQGSGIYLGSQSATVINNTIVAGPGGPQGTAVYFNCCGGQFSNDLLIGFSGQNAVYCDGTSGSAPPTFKNNDVFSAGGTGLGGTCIGQSGQNGNISADPLFVNATSDFHPQPTSPAIDAGTNTAPNLPQTDFAGNPRILDGNNDCVSTVDMGAYELVRSANASFSTNTLTFSTQALTTPSSPLPITLSNTGSGCFQFSSIGMTGDFSQTNNCGAAGVRGGTSCAFNLTFTPTALGTRLGALTVSGSDGITSASPNVSLSGVGVDFSITASPASATVKHGQSVNFTVTVNPIGGIFSSGVALSCSGLPSSTTCTFSPATVSPGQSGTTSVLTVSTAGKTPRGNYSVLVVGKSGTDVHSTTVLLSVN